MDAPLRLDALVAPLRADVVSGAAVVARMAAEVVRRAAGRVPAESVPELRAALAEVGILALNAQPAMAPLVALVREVLDAIDGASDVDSGRVAARKACDEFREGLETRAQVVASRASGLLPEQGDILTLSSSSTVRGALLHHAQRRQGRVIVLESRPMQEGQMLAAALAKVGVPVLFAVDAAAATLVRGCAGVLLGADSVGDLGVVNKLGSLGAAQAASEAGVPVLVVTDETKILPPGFPQRVADERPADEVWRAPANVRVWNRYFEAVPLHIVSSIITESATLTPAEVEDFRQAIRVPDEIRAWAAAQDSPETDLGEPM
jgi:translation initiation factor 2B subunit (eIF-2B alpha/beta/delta family)